MESRSTSSGRDSKDPPEPPRPEPLHQMHCRRSTIYESTFTETQVMIFASVRKLQGQLADVFHKVTHSARQSSVISLPPTTRSSVQKENRGAIKGMHLLCKIWPLNGFKVTHAKHKFQKKRRKICGSFRSWRKTEGPHTLTTHWHLEMRVKIFNGHHCASYNNETAARPG